MPCPHKLDYGTTDLLLGIMTLDQQPKVMITSPIFGIIWHMEQKLRNIHNTEWLKVGILYSTFWAGVCIVSCSTLVCDMCICVSLWIAFQILACCITFTLHTSYLFCNLTQYFIEQNLTVLSFENSCRALTFEWRYVLDNVYLIFQHSDISQWNVLSFQNSLCIWTYVPSNLL